MANNPYERLVHEIVLLSLEDQTLTPPTLKLQSVIAFNRKVDKMIGVEITRNQAAEIKELSRKTYKMYRQQINN